MHIWRYLKHHYIPVIKSQLLPVPPKCRSWSSAALARGRSSAWPWHSGTAFTETDSNQGSAVWECLHGGQPSTGKRKGKTAKCPHKNLLPTRPTRPGKALPPPPSSRLPGQSSRAERKDGSGMAWTTRILWDFNALRWKIMENHRIYHHVL